MTNEAPMPRHGPPVAAFASVDPASLWQWGPGNGATARIKVNGTNKSTDVTLKRGVIADSGIATWLAGVRNGRKVADLRDLTLAQYDPVGRMVRAVELVGCAVSQVYPPPRLRNAAAAAVTTVALAVQSYRANASR